MNRSFAALLIPSVIGCSILSFTGDAIAVIPSQIGGPTQESMLAQYALFKAQVARADYQRVGQHDADWTAEVEQFVADVPCCATSASKVPLRWRDLEQRGRELYLRGCDDALLQYDYSITLVQTDRDAVAERFLLSSPENLAKQGYSPMIRASAASNACGLLKRLGRPNDTAKYVDMLTAAAVEIFKTHLYGKERGLLVRQMHDVAAQLTAPQLKQLWQQVAAVADADQVAVLYLEGVYHHAAAWELRGGGYASEVNPDAWKGFGAELAEATRCLSKAWELDNSVPEPASAMVAVAIATDGLPVMRTWFDRAVAARFNDNDAYNSFINGLLPRWHGDRQMMLAFADECAATRRFDTDVPIRYVDILQLVSYDCDHGNTSLFREPAVYAKAKEIFDKSISSGGVAGREEYIRGLEAAFAVRTWNWDDARQALEQNHGNIDIGAAAKMRLTQIEVKGAAKAYSGPQAADALKARDMAIAGDPKSALAGYRAALAANPDPDAQTFLRGCAQLLQWQVDFATGEPVAIKFDSQLTGFNRLAARWLPEPDGGVVAVSTSEELLLVCEADFGDRWNLSVDIDFLKTAADWDALGIAFTRTDDTSYLGLALNPKSKTLTLRLNRYEQHTTVPAPVADHNVLRVERRGDSFVVWVNGQEINHGTIQGGQRQIAFGGWPLYVNGKVRYRNVTIQKAS